MARHEYGQYAAKWYNIPAHVGAEGMLLGLTDVASGIITAGTLGIIQPRRSAAHILQEDMEVKRVTGHDPALHPLTVGVLGATELFLSATEQGGAVAAAIATVGLGGLPAEGAALAVDAVVDTLIGKTVEAIHYSGARSRGVNLTAIDNAVKLAGIAPIIPVVPTLSLLQWYGRAMARREIRKAHR